MAAAIPAGILLKVGALLRLLSSPIDGEVLGAARAIGRTLRGAGVDWHALADAVEHPAVVVIERPVSAGPRRSRKARPGDIDLDYARRATVSAALRRALDGDRLSDWEHEFATSILARLQAGRGRLTERQGDALGRLLHRLGEASAWV